VVTLGTVAFWHDDEGWGGIEGADRPGVGFAHFSQVRGVQGFRYLIPGEAVEFEWSDGYGQDGCEWRVAWVRLIEPGPDRQRP
jgi:cold shock protein